MKRNWWIWMVVCAAPLAAGCCMCASPFDYCGPTCFGPCGAYCCDESRLNSVFAPLDGSSPVVGEVVHQAGYAASAGPQPQTQDDTTNPADADPPSVPGSPERQTERVNPTGPVVPSSTPRFNAFWPLRLRR